MIFRQKEQKMKLKFRAFKDRFKRKVDQYEKYID
jgi:hypothetical protein